MTQYDQVVEAIKALGGRGTIQDIVDKIDTSGWKALNAYASVACIMSRHEEFTNDKTRKEWVYTPSNEEDAAASKSGDSQELLSKGAGLYLIVLDNVFSEEFPCTLPFKVGLAHSRDVWARLEDYGRSLPCSVIQVLGTYEFPDEMLAASAGMSNTDRKQFYEGIEDTVRGKLAEYDKHGISIKDCRAKKQIEWLEMMDKTFTAKDKRCVKELVDEVVGEVFSGYIAQDKDDEDAGDGQSVKRRSNRSFAELGIKIGSELVYVEDNSIKCVTVNNKNGVVRNGKQYTISGLAKELRGGKSSNGFDWFAYQGKLLTEM